MITSYLIGIIGIVSLMLVWVLIQTHWRQTFSAHMSDTDALAERTKCSNCGCTTACKKKDSIKKQFEQAK